jgi:hypothetical protein
LNPRQYSEKKNLTPECLFFCQTPPPPPPPAIGTVGGRGGWRPPFHINRKQMLFLAEILAWYFHFWLKLVYIRPDLQWHIQL